MRSIALLLLAGLVGGCGGSPAMAPSRSMSTASADSAGGVSGGSDESYRGEPSPEAPVPAPPPEPSAAMPGGTVEPTPATPAPNARPAAASQAAPILIYTAELHLAVFAVSNTQKAVIAIAEARGGFLSQQADQLVVVRVPAARFFETLDEIARAGDVLHRNVQAQDVSEEFNDLQLHIRNAEAMRQRLEVLLEKAKAVEEALAVERELQRLTADIERMKGRLRFLQDRAAFSTITVRFQPRPTDALAQGDEFRLPFPWLDELGLSTLLSLW